MIWHLTQRIWNDLLIHWGRILRPLSSYSGNLHVWFFPISLLPSLSESPWFTLWETTSAPWKGFWWHRKWTLLRHPWARNWEMALTTQSLLLCRRLGLKLVFFICKMGILVSTSSLAGRIFRYCVSSTDLHPCSSFCGFRPQSERGCQALL